MNEEMTGLWLRQKEHICGHLWWLLGTLCSVDSLLAGTFCQGTHDGKQWKSKQNYTYLYPVLGHV